MKKLISILCACCIAMIPVLPNARALNMSEDISSSSITSTSKQTFTIDDGTPNGYTLDILILDDKILTSHKEDDGTTTVMTSDLSTGEMLIQHFNNQTLLTESTDYSTAYSDIDSNHISRASSNGYLWNSYYTNIGSVQYKPNGYTGEKLKLNFQAKEKSHFFREEKRINESTGKTLQWFVQQLVSWGEAAGVFVLASTSVTMTNVLISAGVIFVVSGVITQVTSPKIEATGMHYYVKATEPIGGITHEVTGTYMQCVAGSRVDKTFYDGYYPQFIKANDTKTAGAFFALFRDTGYDGVASFNGTLTVPYK